MIQVDQKTNRQRAKILKNEATIECNILPRIKDFEEDLSSSSMSMYSLYSSEEGLDFLSSQVPTIVIHNTSLSMHEEGICNSPITKKVPFERHSVVSEENHTSSYNIEEIFGSFTFNLHEKKLDGKGLGK